MGALSETMDFLWDTAKKLFETIFGVDLVNLSEIDMANLFIQSGKAIGIILGVLALASTIYFSIKGIVKKFK